MQWCHAINPGPIGLDRQVIDKEAGFKIVRSIEEDVGPFGEVFNIGVVGVYDHWFHDYVGINFGEFSCGGLSLGEIRGNVRLVEEGLALKVVAFDEIAIT